MQDQLYPPADPTRHCDALAGSFHGSIFLPPSSIFKVCQTMRQARRIHLRTLTTDLKLVITTLELAAFTSAPPFYSSRGGRQSIVRTGPPMFLLASNYCCINILTGVWQSMTKCGKHMSHTRDPPADPTYSLGLTVMLRLPWPPPPTSSKHDKQCFTLAGPNGGP